MPRVLVEMDEEASDVGARHLRTFAQAIPVIVSEELTCEGGELAPEEVEVKFRTHGTYDVNVPLCGVTIFANFYQARHDNRDERAARIRQGLNAVAPSALADGITVWVFLGHGAYDAD